MKKVYVGIDLGSKVTCMAAIDSKGKLQDSAQFGTSIKSMVEFIERHRSKFPQTAIPVNNESDVQYRCTHRSIFVT